MIGILNPNNKLNDFPKSILNSSILFSVTKALILGSITPVKAENIDNIIL